MSSEDDNRTDEYWMGVRDALRMVDSFHKWSKRNPSRAKDLEDFIHDGLIAAAKRCESCLRDKMGLSFAEGAGEADEITLEESLDHEEEKPEEDDDDEEEDDDDDDEEEDDDDDDDDDVKPESSIDEPISYVEPEPSALLTDDSDESSISLDSVERIGDEPIDDLSIEGPPREFSTDFELVEPTPMFANDESEPEPIVVTEPEDVLSESTPSEPEQQDYDVGVSEDEISTLVEEVTPHEEPPEPPKVWSPYDEPSIPEDAVTEEETETEVDETEPLDEGDGETVITEPPPPPPPESEEDEEERKRRARRLFFGA